MSLVLFIPMLPDSLFVLLQADNSIFEVLTNFLRKAWEGFSHYFVGEDLLIQAGVLIGIFLLSYLINLGLKPLLKRLPQSKEGSSSWIGTTGAWLRENGFKLLLVILLWSVSLYFDRLHEALDAQAAVEKISGERSYPNYSPFEETRESRETPVIVVNEGGGSLSPEKNYILLRAFASIATLWLVSSALPRAIRSQAYYKTLFFVLAMLLILNLLGVWTGIRDGLDSIHILPIAEGQETRVTALTLLKGVIVILLLIPITLWLLHLSDRRIRSMSGVSPALQMLIVKVVKAALVVAAILFGISSVGVDLSALAVFGGAVGLGLGFGFQKVISNLISGVILLSDRSIKPGDVIEVDDTYGWINKLSARYVSVITRDGMEHLIPNETLITEKVTNWSFSDDKVRVKVPFGVSYHADIHKVMDLAIQAGKETERVIASKEPVCWLLGFGDSSVDFELRVWIRDPANGLNNLRSAIYVRLWDLFKEHNIEIPFPQRDLNFRGGEPIEIRMKRDLPQEGDS